MRDQKSNKKRPPQQLASFCVSHNLRPGSRDEPTSVWVRLQSLITLEGVDFLPVCLCVWLFSDGSRCLFANQTGLYLYLYLRGARLSCAN